MSTTAADIMKAIAEHLGVNVEDLDRQALLREELGLGPIELHDLVAFLAEKFNVAFDPHDIADAKTIEDLIDLTEDNLLDAEL